MNWLDFAYYNFIIALMAGFIMWRENEHIKERRDLLNRLMAKDLGDFRLMDGTRPPPRGGNSVKAGLKRCSGGQGGTLSEG